MDDKGDRLRKAIEELHRYVKDPQKPLFSPDFSKLLEELYLARDAMMAAEMRSCDADVFRS
ncbi:MAG: hypothetical protein WCF22_24465 [Candidatus Sulfotelmatobacter sp.]